MLGPVKGSTIIALRFDAAEPGKVARGILALMGDFSSQPLGTLAAPTILDLAAIRK
jgi:hypothetical protein